MERSEPVLVPEWLKNNGNANHHVAPTSLQSDDHTLSNLAWKKSTTTIIDQDIGRLFTLDQPTSSYLRRSSSCNGSAYFRFNNSERILGDMKWKKDTCQNRDKNKSFFGDLRYRDCLDTLNDIFPSRSEEDPLMITRKPTEAWLRKGAPDSYNANKSFRSNGKSTVSNGYKPLFSHLPLLGMEAKNGLSEGESVPSPKLSSAVQGSQTGKYGVNGITDGSKSVSVPSFELTNHGSSSSSTSTNSLSIDEKLARVPSTGTASQSPAGIQRLEERAIKQSRLLIPITPSLPKAVPKIKIMQQQLQQHHVSSSSQVANNTLRGGTTITNMPRNSSVGKLHVLKQSQEKNVEYGGGSPTERDGWSPSISLRSQNNISDLGSSQSKPTTMEKKLTPRAQSRNDFFNLMRKKSSADTPVVKDTIPAMSSHVRDNSNNIMKEVSVAPLPVSCVKKSPDKNWGDEAFSKGGCDGSIDGGLNLNYKATEEEVEFLRSLGWDEHAEEDEDDLNLNYKATEEEAVFLRSLGWEEHAEEDEGLTEEEINAFYQEYMKLRPSSKTSKNAANDSNPAQDRLAEL